MTKERRDAGIIRVAIAILSYLSDNPTAKDTAEGIAKWWVSEKVTVVEEALQLLAQEGVVKKQKNIYQLAICELTKARISMLQRGLSN